MTRDEYNECVQRVQRLPIQSRVTPVYFPIEPPNRYNRGAPQQLARAEFEAYYGEWRVLGTQNSPFQPGCTYFWNDDAEMRLMGELGRDLAK